MAETGTTFEVRVLLFSVLREKVGADAVTVALASPATGADVLDALGERYPAVRAYRPVVRLAVNERYVAEEAAVVDGDEVALITPVSGG